MPSLGCFAAISNWGHAGLNNIRDYMRGKFVVWQIVTTVQTSKLGELREKNERNSWVKHGEKITQKKETTRRREISIGNKEKSNQVKIIQRKSKGKAKKSKSTNNVSTSACQHLYIPNRTKGRLLPPIQMNLTGRPLPPVPNNTIFLPRIAGNKKDGNTEKMKEIANEEYDDDVDIVFPGENKKAWTISNETEHDDDDDILFPGISVARKVLSGDLHLKNRSMTTTPLTKIDV